eukprot:3754217-Prymnesium_polylepis.1
MGETNCSGPAVAPYGIRIAARLDSWRMIASSPDSWQIAESYSRTVASRIAAADSPADSRIRPWMRTPSAPSAPRMSSGPAAAWAY